MNFEEYFETEFDKDLIIFKNAIPKRAKHYSENPFSAKTLVIQEITRVY